MLMSGLKDTQIIILYLDYTSTITIYGVKLQQFKIDCKLFRYFYRNSMILYHIMLNMKNANILQQEELVVSMN